MSAPPPVLPASLSTSGYQDGLGRRSLAFDRESGSVLERLTLRPELFAFERALRQRADHLATFDDERIARVREVEHDRRTGTLTVVSEFVAGRRLSDLLDEAAERGLTDNAAPSIDQALGLLLQLLPALGALHTVAGVSHGVVGAGRIAITPAGQIVLLDSIYGPSLERLQLSRRRLWAEFRLACPTSAGPCRFDITADIAQAALAAAAITVGRPLGDRDYPDGLRLLLDEAVEIAQLRGTARFATALQRFFERALPLPARRIYATADEALTAVQELVAAEMGIDRCRTALSGLLQDGDIPADVRAEAEFAPPPEVLPPPVPAYVEPFIAPEVEPPVPVALAGEEPVAAAIPIETPIAVEPVIDLPAFDPLSFDAPPFEPAPVEPLPVEAAVFEPAAFVDDAAAPQSATIEPAIEQPFTFADEPRVAFAADFVEEPARAFAPAPEPEPAPELMPVPEPEPVFVAPPEPAAFVEPAVVAPVIVEIPAAAAPAPQAPAPSRHQQGKKRKRARGGHKDKLRSADKPAVAPAPPARVEVPMPVLTPVAVRMPSFDPMPQPVWVPTPAAPLAPIAAAPVAPPPVAPVIAVRVKAEAPAGYVPPISPRAHPGQFNDISAAHHYGTIFRPEAPERSTLWWKIAAAAAIVVAVGVTAGRSSLLDRIPNPARQIEAKAEPAAAPSAPTGSIVVESQPDGARVLIDGNPAGETPLKVDNVATGSHIVTLITSSTTLKRSLKVEAGKTSTLDVPVYSGWVAVFAPVILEVAEGGRTIGSTEHGRIMLPPGRHALTFTNKELGYSAVRKVDIEAGEEKALTIEPRGTISINAVPWAEVYVDGQRVGETPIANFQVPLGTRELLFKHPQFGERRVTEVVTAKAASTVSVDFTK